MVHFSYREYPFGEGGWGAFVKVKQSISFYSWYIASATNDENFLVLVLVIYRDQNVMIFG